MNIAVIKNGRQRPAAAVMMGPMSSGVAICPHQPQESDISEFVQRSPPSAPVTPSETVRFVISPMLRARRSIRVRARRPYA